MDWHPDCLWKRKARFEAVFFFILFVIKVTPVEAELAVAQPEVKGGAAVKLSWGRLPPTWAGGEGVCD